MNDVVKEKKEKKVKEPKVPKTPKKGKRSVIAFESADGNLFRSAEVRDAYEARGDLDTSLAATAEFMVSHLEKLEIVHATDTDDFLKLLDAALDTDLLDKLVDAARRADKANTTT
jgi:hypothetical protein